MVDPSACSSTSGTSGGRSLLDHLATTLGAFWRRHQPPPPSQQHPKPDAVVDADAAGALLLARVSTIKASKSYIERQVAECIREQRQSKEDEDGPERRGVVVETPARVVRRRRAYVPTPSPPPNLLPRARPTSIGESIESLGFA